ncbi:P-loop containing nucleoside triphosphate hydrolase protein [Mycena capillaripes]|nr:P-loop containing nucleoside triphosphate hydrolase protein [Mycena capillaripes]
MHRRFSSFIKSPSTPSTSRTGTINDVDDAESKGSTIGKDEPLPPASLKIKRVDYFYSQWSKSWKSKNTNSKVTVETLPLLGGGNTDPWKDYSFVVVRTIPPENGHPTFKIIIKSPYIIRACKDVIQTWPGVSWNAEPLELEPEMFLTWFPRFTDYRDALAGRKQKSEEDANILASVNILLSFVATDYRSTIATIERLTAHGEITFDLLYSVFVPRTLVVARCAITGLERLFELQSFTRTTVDSVPVYQLALESIDLVSRPALQNVALGRVSTYVNIPHFKGATRIDSLDVYPLTFHASEAALRASVVQRGKAWVGLIGVHHMQYSGIAVFKEQCQLVRHSVNGRIMIDRATFQRLNANYMFPLPVAPKNDMDWDIGTPNIGPYGHGGMPMNVPMNGSMNMPPPAPLPPPIPRGRKKNWPSYIPPQQMWAGQGLSDGGLVQSQANATTENADLSAEDLLLTPTVVHGFSLSDKKWLEFDVTKVAPVDWNDDAFANLVLPGDRKTLLRSLVEAHHAEVGFDDFVKGKGAGLVVNLFGPPGVGKTFSAEATSEHVKRPLYVVGAGDLGTRAEDLDLALQRVFDVATAWKAIVLIDEADVFLERRSLHDLKRNAMVAVFLRHVEYYRGILFLTSNRVQAYDAAFLSRIHVALHFGELDESSRGQVWRAFVRRAGGCPGVSDAELELLAQRPVNGRQIKNAVRTAHSLARARNEEISIAHFVETLDAMDEFTEQFEGMRVAELEGGH